MTTSTIALPPSVQLMEGPGGIDRLYIDNGAATAILSLQGAHILSFIPRGEDDVIWLSPEARFAEGKSVRGGVPICWPWFGAHASDTRLPAHGYARTVPWRLVEASEPDPEHTRLCFELSETDHSHSLWPHNTPVRYCVTIGEDLYLTLETLNADSQTLSISAALHTYFHIGDITNTVVDGLQDCDYLDKVEGFARKHQQGKVEFSSETDRIYLQTGPRCDILDITLQRRIIIESEGSHSTVVWNPWQAQAQKMGDLGEDGYKHMLCVETANAADDAVNLQPGKTHTLTARYRIAPI